MGAVLTIVVSAYFFMIFHRLKFAFFLFVFLLPFLPKYIGFGMGGEGMALSLKRIIVMILFISLVLSFTQNREYISQRISLVYQQNKMLINLLLLFSILKVISLSLNSWQLLYYIMLFNDFLLTGFVFILTILLITSKEDINRLVKMFFYGYVIVLILTLIESFTQYPLLGIFMSGGMQLEKDYSESVFRGAHYRASGSFLTSITLGEYLVLLFPIAVAYIYRHKYSLILKVVFFLLFCYAVYSTGSRSTILMSVVMIYFYLLIILYRGDQLTRFIVNIFNLILAGFSFYFIYNYISNLVMNFHGRYDLLGVDSETISSTSRALQYVRVYDIMHEAPFFGFGRMMNFRDFLGSAIDNRYFWMIMEVGIIGISVYFLFLFTLAKTALNLYKSPYKNDYAFPFLLSVLLYIPYKVLTVGDANLIYLDILLGLICVMKVIQNDKIMNYKDNSNTINFN